MKVTHDTVVNHELGEPIAKFHDGSPVMPYHDVVEADFKFIVVEDHENTKEGTIVRRHGRDRWGENTSVTDHGQWNPMPLMLVLEGECEYRNCVVDGNLVTGAYLYWHKLLPYKGE